jgi:hypothetical protein
MENHRDNRLVMQTCQYINTLGENMNYNWEIEFKNIDGNIEKLQTSCTDYEMDGATMPVQMDFKEYNWYELEDDEIKLPEGVSLEDSVDVTVQYFDEMMQELMFIGGFETRKCWRTGIYEYAGRKYNKWYFLDDLEDEPLIHVCIEPDILNEAMEVHKKYVDVYRASESYVVQKRKEQEYD